jgi:hypothetical protein
MSLQSSPAWPIYSLAAAFLVAVPFSIAQADQTINIQVAAGKHDRANTPIGVEIAVEPALKNAALAALTDDSGHKWLGQLTDLNLLAMPAAGNANQFPRELHFILPDLKAGQTAHIVATLANDSPDHLPSSQSFHWHDTPGEHDDLIFGNRAVLRYMYHPLDESSAYARMETFKPYHHVFDPTGEILLTKGPGGLWPHHHGVFYGFREVTYDGDKKCDIWHCPAAFQQHSAFLASEAGPVLGRQLLQIDWIAEPKLEKAAKGDEPNQTFAKEQRELTAYNIPGGTLIEFASRLTAVLPPLHLDGDPQHSGLHFRASEDVHALNNQQTYFLRPDGKGQFTEHEGKGNQGDETRNWDAKTKDPRTVNMPWDAMSFVVDKKRYTLAYLDNQNNPKPSRGSEREYGRIGSYFVADLTDTQKPLDVDYRLWIQSGEMTVDQCAALDADFDDPPQVSWK